MVPGAFDPFAGLLDVDEPPQQVEPRVLLPDPLPQVGGAVAVRVRRVALAAVVAPVEGQKACRGTLQPRRHGDLLGVYREVDDRPARG